MSRNSRRARLTLSKKIERDRILAAKEKTRKRRDNIIVNPASKNRYIAMYEHGFNFCFGDTPEEARKALIEETYYSFIPATSQYACFSHTECGDDCIGKDCPHFRENK